jgi:dienelactone hydrolase
MTEPEFLQPFVLKTEARVADASGLYLPDAEGPQPALVLVHGGPLPDEVRPTPKDWPVFQGYARLLASEGVVAAVAEHGLNSPAAYPRAASRLATAVEEIRADPRVDADRIGMWFFSGGGLLLADYLAEPPAWLRVAAASYPLLAPPAGWPVDPRYRPAETVAAAGQLPIVLTRVGREDPMIAEGVEEFVTAAVAARARLEIVDVPDGRHSFDLRDDTDQSRAAIVHAATSVVTALRS